MSRPRWDENTGGKARHNTDRPRPLASPSPLLPLAPSRRRPSCRAPLLPPPPIMCRARARGALLTSSTVVNARASFWRCASAASTCWRPKPREATRRATCAHMMAFLISISRGRVWFLRGRGSQVVAGGSGQKGGAAGAQRTSSKGGKVVRAHLVRVHALVASSRVRHRLEHRRRARVEAAAHGRRGRRRRRRGRRDGRAPRAAAGGGARLRLDGGRAKRRRVGGVGAGVGGIGAGRVVDVLEDHLQVVVGDLVGGDGKGRAGGGGGAESQGARGSKTRAGLRSTKRRSPLLLLLCPQLHAYTPSSNARMHIQQRASNSVPKFKL